MGKINIKQVNDIGKNLFHVRFISLSYRIRGKVARTHTNNIAKVIVFNVNIKSVIIMEDILINKTQVNNLITKIFMYSAIKIIANNPLLYSTLNPDTSSDSPSAKSNGVRFVSAKFVVNQVTANGKIIKIISELYNILVKSMVIIMIRVLNKINDILTSYEIVWATPRSAPSNAYLEFDLHPAINVIYTFILDTHRKYNTLNWRKND
jgi:hypothetical protein